MLLAPARMLVNFICCIFAGLGTLGLGLLQTLCWLVVTTTGHLVAAATNVRIFNKTEDKNISGPRALGFVISSFACFIAAATALVMTCVGLFSSTGSAHEDVLKVWANASAHVPYLGYILLAMLGTNVISLLYEVGKMNGGIVFDSNAEEAVEEGDDVPEVPELENALDAMDKLEKIEEMTMEFAAEWFKKIEEMLKRGAIDSDEANNLRVLVENRLPSAEKSRV